MDNWIWHTERIPPAVTAWLTGLIGNPLLVDLTIPFISGVHLFQDSLFVGQNVSSGAAPAGGTGPKLSA